MRKNLFLTLFLIALIAVTALSLASCKNKKNVPADTTTESTTETPVSTILLITASDFQDPLTSYSRSDYAGNGDYSAQNARLSKIFGKITDAYGPAYGFIAGGDYCFDETKNSKTKTETGIKNIRDTVKASLGEDVNVVCVQGNHDLAGSEGLSPTGANDTEYYGVFVLNEEEYRSYPLTSSKWKDYKNSKSIAEELSKKLDAYLKEKVDNGYDKPVFVVSHVPLHFSTRSVDKGDAIYASYFVDVLNKYGTELNIFFLFGHDHAWGDDDYLGGSAVYIARGENINVAKLGSQKEFDAKTINFTYMNFGYTGYFWSKWDSSSKNVRYSDADGTLTMTAFQIAGDSVTVTRWDENGQHDLKSEGKPSQGNRGVKEPCTPYPAVVESGVTVVSPKKETEA